ncbi:ComEC/Rec2 family competence protein [Candidatus Parcubacteria bacterium]|nr:ComEC/Rec2 family competence protein [Candidatus Parcubacteria bacterium]
MIFLCALALGALRFDVKDFHELLPMESTGMVASEPEHRDMDTRFVFESDNGERALVSTDLLSGVQYGDRVEVSANFKVPGVIVDETGRSFDYGAYLSKDDIYYTANFAKVAQIAESPSSAHGQASVDSRPTGSRLISGLLKVKNSFVEKMRQILPEPESSLLAGLIVAGKQALPKSILDEFRRAGVVHIVVLSGYNLTVISEFLLVLLAFLGKRRSALVSAVAIVAFTLMTGATATVVRAAIMILLVLLGRIIARPGSSPRILLFTGVVMLLENPKELVFDPSFQLTFLAMLALIYTVPIFERFLTKIPEKFGLRTLLATTLGVQVVVLPYILYNMGNFSTVFLLSNLLILFVVPFTMLIGFAATILAYVSGIIAWPLAFISHLLLSWILFVAGFLGNLKWASIQIQSFPLWLTLLIYVVLGTLIFAKEEARELVSRFRSHWPKKTIVSPRSSA